MDIFNECRTCLKPKTAIKSLQSKVTVSNACRTYMELLQYTAHLEIIHDFDAQMPKGICTKCAERLLDAYTYVEAVHNCNQYYLKAVQQRATECVLPEEYGEHNNLMMKCEPPEITNICILTAPQENQNHQFAYEGEYQDSTSLVNASQHSENEESLNAYTVHIVKEEPNYAGFTEASSSNCSYLDSAKEMEMLNPRHLTADEIASVHREDDMLPVHCDKCKRVYKNAEILRRHQKYTHLPEKLKIQCPKCPVKFSRRDNMYAHMRTYHKEEAVTQHQLLKRKENYTDICEHCHRAYSNKYELRTHIKRQHGPGARTEKPKKPPIQYLCTLCAVTCTNKPELIAHMRQSHKGSNPYKCNLCECSFPRFYELKVHKRSHAVGTLFKCTVCAKAFKKASNLTIHMRTHSAEFQPQNVDSIGNSMS